MKQRIDGETPDRGGTADHETAERARVPRRPMTEVERALVTALARCSFPVASPPKRFARDLASQADATGEITERQAEHLRRLVARFRRQIRPSALPESERWLLTDEAARKLNTRPPPGGSAP